MLISWNNLNIFKFTLVWNYMYTCLWNWKRHKDFLLNFLKGHKYPKEIEKNKDICFSFDTLGEGHFETLQFVKCLF